MSTDIEDPFAGASPDDDEFATPGSGFVDIHELKDRLCIFVPLRTETETSKQNGKPYTRIVADVIVLDGPTTELMPELPHLIEEFFVSSKLMVGQMRRLVGKGRPMLGRVNGKPSSYNKQVLAYGIGDPEESDKVLASPAWHKYRAGQFA